MQIELQNKFFLKKEMQIELQKKSILKKEMQIELQIKLDFLFKIRISFANQFGKNRFKKH